MPSCRPAIFTPESSRACRRTCSLCLASLCVLVSSFPSFLSCSFFSFSFSFFLALASASLCSSSRRSLSSSSARFRSSSSSRLASSSAFLLASCCCWTSFKAAAGIFFPLTLAGAAGAVAAFSRTLLAADVFASSFAGAFAFAFARAAYKHLPQLEQLCIMKEMQ